MIEKIVSGGQTGVDRAALDAAIEFNIPHGGWCPKGRLAEDKTIPPQYILQETVSSDYSERTKLNVKDSDGTLIFVPSLPIKVTDGTLLTFAEVKEKNKSYFIVDLSNSSDVNDILDWIKEKDIKILNVAGPRESQSPGIYKISRKLMEKVIKTNLQNKMSGFFKFSKL